MMDSSASVTSEEQAAQVNGQASDGQRTPIEVIPGTNLYVKNLADSIDDEQLKQIFERFGTITSAKVMTEPQSGRSKGFGFVCFTTVEHASNAMNSMNGTIIASKPLYVAVAQKKEERRAFLSRQYRERMAWSPQTGSQPTQAHTPPIPQSPVAQPAPPMATTMVPGHVSPHSPQAQQSMSMTPPINSPMGPFGGMNNFMLMPAPQIGQAATAQTGYYFQPASMQQVYATPTAGRAWQPAIYPSIQTHQGQAITGVRYQHMVPASPAPASILSPSNVRPVHLGHQSYNSPLLSHPPFTVPMALGHTATVNSFQGVAMHPMHSASVAAAAYNPHAQTRWGMHQNHEGH